MVVPLFRLMISGSDCAWPATLLTRLRCLIGSNILLYFAGVISAPDNWQEIVNAL